MDSDDSLRFDDEDDPCTSLYCVDMERCYSAAVLRIQRSPVLECVRQTAKLDDVTQETDIVGDRAQLERALTALLRLVLICLHNAFSCRRVRQRVDFTPPTVSALTPPTLRRQISERGRLKGTTPIYS
jgi:hypothetical protein